MKSGVHSLTRLNDEDREILYRFMAFTDSFSVDWFVDRGNILPSRLFSVVTFLQQHRWIKRNAAFEGFYEWTSSVPRNELLKSIPACEMSQYYREAVDIYTKCQPESNEKTLRIANLCLLAGIQERDIELIYQAACLEEKNHKISSAIKLCDQLLDYLESLIAHLPGERAGTIYAMFIRIVERRASLSPFDPNIKKIYPNLSIALDIAHNAGDIETEASLELLIGQNYWMSFQYEKAEAHFKEAWNLIRKTKNPDLTRRGFQSQGLSFWLQGNFPKAIRCYEKSIGMIDSLTADDFSMLASLQLALCYTQVGMPQRGLGLSENIYNHAVKTHNSPLAAYALSTTGLILLEIKELKNSRTYFEMAIEMSKKEALPMAEIISGIGLANIECIEGNYEAAEQLFKVRYKIKKSSWYHTLNSSHAFETGMMMYKKGIHFAEQTSVIQYLNKIKKDQVNPVLYGIIRRLQIQFQNGDDPMALKEKVASLVDLESHVKQVGETFELAKIRIDLARNYLLLNQWHQAEKYGRKAWSFLKPIARVVFPSDLTHLIPVEDLSMENRLFDAVIEMGEALNNQKQLEPLLTNIVNSISRLTGAERAALFITDKETRDLRMVASRNLSQDEITNSMFQVPLDIMRSSIINNDGKITFYKIDQESAIGFHDVIITPLQLDKKIVGALYQESRFFSFGMGSDHIKLLSALTSQIAVAIDRAQAYNEIARMNERLNQTNRYDLEETEEPHTFGDIIGHHPSMLHLHQLIRKIAPTQLTVTIYGETGVGKELVARAIHRESSRSKAPFIRVNCAALSESLIDSELFGHDKGAFTGAITTKAGRFELANNGTIFLDEISELPSQTQSKLLRVIQEKEFQRVGGTETLYSDFRLIAATNKDLSKEMECGNFRPDLFYRLNVTPITLIPLRERKADVPLLVAHFAKKFCRKYNRDYEGISEFEMGKFMNYTWPGNIRELANMIERSILLNGAKVVFPELQVGNAATSDWTGKQTRLEDIERAHIINILKKTQGKIGGLNGASSLLGLKRTTLIHRMKKLSISLDKVLRV